MILEAGEGSKMIRVCSQLGCAETVWTRFRGLLGRASMAAGEGLWISPCNSIHTLFMKFSIDAIFADANNRIVKVVHGLRPWRMTLPVLGARHVIEISAGEASRLGLKPGMELKRS